MTMEAHCKFSLFAVIIIILDIHTVLSNKKDDHIDKKYLISTEGCKIPTFPIMSNIIRKLITPANEINCSANVHLLEANSSHISILEDSLDVYNVFNINDFYCCYRHFFAETNIAQIKYGSCVEFKKVIRAKHEFLRVECFYLDSKIYDDFFLFPQFARPKIHRKPLPDFNVLMFGVESMSRINFLRMMPRTSKFLQDKGSIQLLGYNKVGDNSFPNLFPLLVGKSFKQVKQTCIEDNVIDTNKCIFIWNLFKAAGYYTALASDSIAGLLGTYEYSLSMLPTDFYLQPFIFETRNIFKNMFYNFHQCLHNKYFYKMLLNWSASLLKIPNKKLFGLFWEESISHDNFNLPQDMDIYHYNYFKELEKSKYFDNSIVILFSDHGMRFGSIAQTKQGRVENRLPLFEILFPREFQTRYPLAFKNFKENRHHLTSPYDIHATLLDILHNNLDDSEIIKRSKTLPSDLNSISLFLPIPPQRTCKSLFIDEHWCTCEKNETVLLSEKQKVLASSYLIQHINKILTAYPQCHQLKLHKILDVQFNKEPKSKNLTYRIIIQTLPGGGIFEATILESTQESSISGIVTRLNLYRHSSQCIEDVDVKMYCTCTFVDVNK